MNSVIDNCATSIVTSYGRAKGWLPGKEFGFIRPAEGGADVFVTYQMVKNSGFMPGDFIFDADIDMRYTTAPNGRRRVERITSINGTAPEEAAFVFAGKLRPGVEKRRVDYNQEQGQTLLKLVLDRRFRYAIEEDGKFKLLPPMTLTAARAEIGRVVEPPKTAPGKKTNIGATGHAKA